MMDAESLRGAQASSLVVTTRAFDEPRWLQVTGRAKAGYASVVSLLFLLVACSPEFPPAGIALESGQPVIHYKLCQPRVLGELTIRRGTAGPVIWSARMTDGTLAKTSLPIAPVVPGYEIVDRLDGGLTAGETYSLSAKDEKGVNVESGFQFSGKDLQEGLIRDRHGKRADLERWLTGKPKCR
jgi:hypothetical protein